MKKITVETLYTWMTKVVPSPILQKIKKSSFYKKGRDSARKHLNSNFMPTWNVIKTGDLAGVKLYVDPHGQWQKEMLEGTYDDFFFDYLKKVQLEGKYVFDIGAHIGFSALYFAKAVGTNGKVVTFEPNTFNIERINLILAENPELASRIKVVQAAISDKNGTEDFIFSDNVDNGTSSGSFIENAHTIFEKPDYETKGGFKRVQVKTMELDSLLEDASYPIPDVLKIDIEGAEYLALGGAKNLIEKHKPLLLIEIHSIFNMLKVGEQLHAANYAIELLKEESDGRCFIAAKPAVN
jgi:FkbM family methyltransferase